MTKMLFFDIESGGLTTDHAILQISGIIDINGKVMEEFDFYVKPFPTDLIDDKALEINGIKREEIENFEEPSIVCKKIITIFNKYIDKYDKTDKFILIGHNIVHFDVPMLINWFYKNNEKYFGSFLNLKKKLDTLCLVESMRVLKVLPDSPNNKLGVLCEEYGIKAENLHNSLNDIRVNRELAYKLAKLIKFNLKGDIF